PLRVDRGNVVAREVIGPHLDVVEPREIRRKERADGAATDDTDLHASLPAMARVLDLGHGPDQPVTALWTLGSRLWTGPESWTRDMPITRSSLRDRARARTPRTAAGPPPH